MTSPRRQAVSTTKFQGARGNAILCAKLGHEPGDLGMIERGVMLRLFDLVFPRQQIFQMRFPSGRIFTLAMAGDPSPIQYAFDPGPHARGGFRFRRPDRRKALHHKRGVDRVDRERTDHRVRVIP